MPATFKKNIDSPAYKGQISINTGLFINGEFVDASEGETIEVVDPCTRKVITEVSLATAQDVDAAVAAAKHAMRTVWGLKYPAKERVRLLNKYADLLEQHRDELCAIEALDTGKPFESIRDWDFDVAISSLRYFAGIADKHDGKTVETRESKFAYTRHEPIGVVGVITPWNFPLILNVWKIGPILATGNCLVLKPSEITPLGAHKLAMLATEAGFPPGVFNVVTGYGADAGHALAAHPDVGKIAFTGSTAVGRLIMETAAKTNLKRVTLELGGKSPVLVFDDADLRKAIPVAVGGAFFHSGQICAAGSRIYVQEGIYDKFLAQFTEATKAIKRCNTPFGGVEEESHTPIVSQRQFERVMSYVDSGKQDGATLHTGGEQLGDGGFYLQPTIFTDATPDMNIAREEIFGPVVIIVKFKDEATAIELANNSSYGLSSVVMTESLSRALRVAHAIESGNVYVNTAFKPEASLPFGGVKQSGFGKDASQHALEEYTIVKAVHIEIDGVTDLA